MRHLALLLALMLALAVPLRAVAAVTVGTTAWLEGGETQNLALSCAGGVSGTASVETTNVRSGAAAIRVARSGSVTGTCTLVSGLSLTGTIWIVASFYLTASNTCGTFDAGGGIFDFGEVKIALGCANGTNNYTLRVQENSADMGATPAVSLGSYFTVRLKIVTGASSTGSVGWDLSTDGANWVDQGTTTGRTIVSVTGATLSHFNVSSIASFTVIAMDDFVMLDDPGGSGPDVKTYVNMRSGKTAAPNADAWTKTGGSGGNIYTVWTQRTAPSLTYPGSQYAGNTSATTTDAGQTMLFNDWSAGSPAPAIPASAAGVSQIWGAKVDVYGARGAGTNRAYAYRVRLGGTNDDTTFPVTLSNSAWGLTQFMFDIVNGGGAAAELTDLNAMEIGGVKTNTASGAPMLILDEWVQVAWSVVTSTGAGWWIQDE